MIKVPIANGFYVSSSLPLSAQECVNWFPVISETQTLSEAYLLGAPGLNQILSTGDPKNRGSHTMAGVAYFVNGESLFKLVQTIAADGTESFSTTTLGTITGSSRLSFADNGTQLCIVDPGTAGYVYNVDTDTFSTITDADFTANGNSEKVVFLDGFFVHVAGKKIFHSNLNDATAYTATDFGSAEADPDDIVAPHVYNNQLYILGSETIEVYRNVGGSGFVFQRIDGFVLQKGLSSRDAIQSYDDGFAFLGSAINENPAVWLFKGNQAQRISTIPIENEINGESGTDVSNSFAWTYSQDGATFFGVTIGSKTFVYDSRASSLAGRPMWHERTSFIEGAFQAYRVNSVTVAYGRTLIGDSVSGRIGEIRPDIYTEYSNNIHRKVATQPFANNGSPVFLNKVELTMNSGAGNSDVTDPIIRMDQSDDGITFNNSRDALIGKKGNFDTRIYWNRCGRSPRFRVLRFTLTDEVDPTVIKLEIDIDA